MAKNKICSACKGKGQTKDTMTVVKEIKPKEWQTTQLGYGCLTCGGLGIEGERK